MKLYPVFTITTTIMLYCLPINLFCCDTTLNTPTDRGRCEELLREHQKLQKDLQDKYDLTLKMAPKEKLALEEKKIDQESEHLERDYAKRIQELHQIEP